MKLNLILQSVVIVLMLFLVNSLAYSTIVDVSFEKIRLTPPLCADVFDFVVMGDNRPSEPGNIPDVFVRMIEEWNILKPSFIIDVGDLILGGSAHLLDEQWNEFKSLVNKIESPFFPVPGNHDISDRLSEEIYKSRIGPTCYAFSYGNSRFIILNSEEPGQIDSLSEEQIDWLKKELANIKSKHIFVFLHKPYFQTKPEKWSTVESLFLPFPSVYVFAGHDHRYLYYGRKEGIHYIISAGGGAEIRRDEEEGGFHHYLLVKVRGAQVSWSVIRPGNILPMDVVTQEKVERRENWREIFRFPPVECGWGEPVKTNIIMNINNPFNEDAEVKIDWSIPQSWQVNTTLPELFTLRKGGVAPHSLSLTWIPTTDFKIYPVPEMKVWIKQGNEEISFSSSLMISPVISIPELPDSILIDGDLSDWNFVPSYPVLYPANFDVFQNTQDLQANWRGGWNKNGVYMAVEVLDNEFYQPYSGDIVWCADNLELFLGEWEWSLSLTSKGTEVFMYEGPNREEETLNEVVKLAVNRKGNYIYYEVLFPPSEVAPLSLSKGERVTFSIIVNDLDSQGPLNNRHWLEFTPGAGSGREDFPRCVLVLK